MGKYIFILGMLCAGLAHAGKFYSERPNISEISEKNSITTNLVEARQQLDDQLLGSIVNYVAELRILYGKHRRAHLGRDGELPYDLDHLVWETEGKQGVEPILVNVSRASALTDQLYHYLKAKRLTKGELTVLGDTGYEGSVVDAINQNLEANGKPTLLAHLMSSVHPKSPSSRVSTQPFYAKKKLSKKLTSGNKDEFLDRVDEQVDRIEELSHYTTTATEFRVNPKTGLWDAFAPEDSTEADREISVGLQILIRKGLEGKHGFLQRIQSLVARLEPFIDDLKNGKVDAENVARLYAYTVEERFDLFWPDLRETIAKGNLSVPPSAILKVWEALPTGMPELFDLEEDEARLILANEAELHGLQKGTSESRLLIEEILDFHAEEQRGSVPAKRKAQLAELRNSLATGSFRFGGRDYPVGEMLGEGVRAEVFELEEKWVLKVPFEGDDTRYIAVEGMVSDYLQKHFDEYHIRVVPPLARGEDGTYIVRERIAAKKLAENISRKNLSSEQMKALEQLFLNTKRFAAKTGVGLDIKYDNLAWMNGDWALFDVGPRTSYGPYAFSLDIKDFEEFFRLWRDDSPRENGITIKQVIESHANGDCAEALLKGRKNRSRK